MASCSERTFTFKLSSGEEFNLKALENSEYVQDHSSIIWAASIVFSHWILSHRDLFSNQSVLELGSGCGKLSLILYIWTGNTSR